MGSSISAGGGSARAWSRHGIQSDGWPVGSPSQMSGYLPTDLRLSSKRELIEVLQVWLSDSNAETIGDVGLYGGKAWLKVQLPAHTIVLNADTRRDAIKRFVRARTRQPPTRRGVLSRTAAVASTRSCPPTAQRNAPAGMRT
jgi:hypothetical protein